MYDWLLRPNYPESIALIGMSNNWEYLEPRIIAIP